MPGAAGPGSLGEAVGADGNATNPAAELRGAPAGASEQSAPPSVLSVASGFAAEFGIALADCRVVADADTRRLFVLAQRFDTELVERARAYLGLLCRGFPGWSWDFYSAPDRAAAPRESQPRLFRADPLGR